MRRKLISIINAILFIGSGALFVISGGPKGLAIWAVLWTIIIIAIALVLKILAWRRKHAA